MKDEVTNKSIINFIMDRDSTLQNVEANEEIKCIMTIIENFAMDGIDVRGKLCEAVLNSDCLSWIKGMI